MLVTLTSLSSSQIPHARAQVHACPPSTCPDYQGCPLETTQGVRGLWGEQRTSKQNSQTLNCMSMTLPLTYTKYSSLNCESQHHIIYNSRTGTEGSFCPPGCAYLCCASQGTPCINSTGLIPPSEHECNALFHSFSYSQSTCFTAFSCPGHFVLATWGQIHEIYASLFHLRTCLPQFLTFLRTAKAFLAQLLKKMFLQAHRHAWNGFTGAVTVMASACTPSKACKEVAQFFYRD